MPANGFRSSCEQSTSAFHDDGVVGDPGRVIGFAFDTYELLMLPLIAGPALSEVLQCRRVTRS